MMTRLSGWLDRYGGDADKTACLVEAAGRDLRAAAWIIAPADHGRLPLGWQSVADGTRGLS